MSRHLLIDAPQDVARTWCGAHTVERLPRQTSDGLIAFVTCRASTRTRLSTASAARRLGLGFVEIPWESFYLNPEVHHRAVDNLTAELISMARSGVVALVARTPTHAYLQSLAEHSP